MSDRRDFIKNAARGIAGMFLAGGTGWLALGSGEPCWRGGACRQCPELDGCEQPEARIVRVQRRPRASAQEHGPTGEEPVDR